jgi:hypothetical protein
VASIFIENVTSFASLAALEALADADALEAELLAAALVALVEALAALADADVDTELAAELEACCPHPASIAESASANATARIERSFELRFI